MTDNVREGWGWPGNARKARYFVGALALGSRWMFTGDLEPDNGATSRDDCAACRRAFVARSDQGGGA